MILFEKYEQHQPLNRQRDHHARGGVDLSLSTLTDQVGACTVARRPLHDLIAAFGTPPGSHRPSHGNVLNSFRSCASSPS